MNLTQDDYTRTLHKNLTQEPTQDPYTRNSKHPLLGSFAGISVDFEIEFYTNVTHVIMLLPGLEACMKVKVSGF